MIYSREMRRMIETWYDPCLDPKCGLKLCRIRQTTYCPPIRIRWRPDFAKIALREMWAIPYPWNFSPLSSGFLGMRPRP